MMESAEAQSESKMKAMNKSGGYPVVGERDEAEPNDYSAQKSKSSSHSESEIPLANLVTAASRVLEQKRGKNTSEKGESSRPLGTHSKANENNEGKPHGETKAAPGSAVGGTLPTVLRGTKEDLIRAPNLKPTFAEQLYDALEDEEHHDVLQWTPNGKSFAITNHKKFTLYKMSKLFNIRNMSSFVRKLGRWGFTRVHEKQGNNADIFCHPEFVRGDRTLVKRKVKCMGRLFAAASGAAQQQREHAMEQQLRSDREQIQQPGMGGPSLGAPLGGYHSLAPSTALRREADPTMPLRSQGPLYEGAPPFYDVPLNEANTIPSMVLEPSLDRVTDASAASAEALFLSHRNQQQSNMELLAREQQEQLNEREIQNLLRQRELQQRELEAQKRHIIWEQQQLAQEAARRSSVFSAQQEQFQAPMSSIAGMRSGLSDLSGCSGMAQAGASSHDMSFTDHRNLRSASSADQQLLFDLEEQQRRQIYVIQGRRGLLTDHSQHSNVDDNVSRNMTGIQSSMHAMTRASERSGGQPLLSRYSMDGGALGGDMIPTSEHMGSLQAPMTSLPSGDDARARQRKAVIQALLREEEEWEMKRRAEVVGMEQQQQQTRLNQQQQQFFPQQNQQYQQNNMRQQQIGLGQQNNMRQQQIGLGQHNQLLQQQIGRGQQNQLLQQQIGLGQQNQLLQQQQDQNPHSDSRIQLHQLEQLKFQQEQHMMQQQQMRRGQHYP